MNQLVFEMNRSLNELQLGFKGELTMSEQMEQLANSLFLEKIPPRLRTTLETSKEDENYTRNE